MTTTDRRWTAALREHEEALRLFLEATARVPAAEWTRPPAPGRWSPAAMVLHVAQAYELGRDAAGGDGAGMRLRVPPLLAWASRTFLLPAMLASRRFPRNAPAPREVRPDIAAAERVTPAEAAARLARAAADAAKELRLAADRRPMPRVSHAYFGPLTPLATLRLLSAHTRHHALGLLRRHDMETRGAR